MSEKYGFVYIWYDRKHKRYYVGSHWGTEDDGYICSSRWMRKAYRRRPEDFKRRIIKRIYSDYQNLIVVENRYLQMIDHTKLGVRYYNRLNRAFGNTWQDNIQRQKIIQAIQNSNRDMITVRYPHETKYFRVKKNDPLWLNGQVVNSRGRKRNPRTKKGYMKGETHYSFTGYFVTPWGRFATTKEAATSCPYGPIGECTILRWCKDKSDQIFHTKGRPPKIMHPRWWGKTRREVGFWFEQEEL